MSAASNGAEPLADESASTANRASCCAAGGRLLEARQHLLELGAAGEQARLRRDREQVLREPVVDLARDARALLGDGTPELGRPDRAPDADEQDRVGEQPQEVALRDVVARERRREDRVELGEEPDRRAEREPAVEILAVGAVAKPEADEGSEPEQRLERERRR